VSPLIPMTGLGDLAVLMGGEPSMADADKDKLKKNFELRAFAVERKMRGIHVSPLDLTDADFLAWARVQRSMHTMGAGCTYDPCDDGCEDGGNKKPKPKPKSKPKSKR
jgi:hypothetical protein